MLLVAAPRARAQQEYQRSGYRGAAVYNYADVEEVAMQVKVWGAVQNPGLYRLAEGTRLQELFTLAGGPSIGTRRYTTDLTLRLKLVRAGENGSRRVVYKTTMDDEILVSDENPILKDGDVLTVEGFTRRGIGWRDVLSIGSSLISLALSTITLISVLRPESP